MVRADLKALRWLAFAIPLLIAVAVAMGVGIGAQERMLRQSSARAADDFDLVIGAAGSQTQLVLTTVYLDLEALPLTDGALLNTLSKDPRVAAVAPIAFGDVVRGFPVVGTTPAFAGRWGRVAATEGRLFEKEGEALIGADVSLKIGETFAPSHATGGATHAFQADAEEETRHRHEGVTYTVVGRLPRLGTPWDRAILVPVESVWETHGLGNGHAQDDAELGPPFDAKTVPGVPAIVVKPKRVADAYALRSSYRQGGTMAVFPAEVLVSLYKTVGDVRDVLVASSWISNGLIFVAVLLLLLTLTGLRRRRYAVLRALGAPAVYILTVVWLEAAILLATGCGLGLIFGWGAAALVSRAIEAETGLRLAFSAGLTDVLFVVGLIGLGSLLALIPAVLTYRLPVSDALRS
ncbi:ABC transporter permease [Microvirga sp. BT350]|uniref:ABC transporter permease n=2 Tax=Microvirga alba TaxID=2791025 RepID=A0A931BQM7_9HYPH|nr:ABC transporter permease [Microvirga alba]